MDELEAIEYKLDRFCTNVTNIHDRADQNLDDLISFISNIKKNIDGKVEAAAAAAGKFVQPPRRGCRRRVSQIQIIVNGYFVCFFLQAMMAMVIIN